MKKKNLVIKGSILGIMVLSLITANATAQTIVLMDGVSGATTGIEWFEDEDPTGQFYDGYSGTSDNYLRGRAAYADRNYGSYTLAFVGKETDVSDYRALYKFELSGLTIPDPALLVKAELALRSSTTHAGMVVDVFRTDGAWIEGSSNNAVEVGAYCENYRAYNTVAWSNTIDSGRLGDFYDTDASALNEIDSPYASQTMSTAGWYRWDVTDMVNEWLAGTYDNEGFELVSQVTSGSVRIYTSEYALGETTYRRPALVLTYVPEPATIVLLASGAWLSLVRRKRN